MTANARVSARFTVAIPTHDRCELVLLSIASVLAQTRPAERVLVLCDGCTDGTADAVRALREPSVITVELAKGPGFAYPHRNVPLEDPDTDIVMWLGDDDLVLPDHLAQLGQIWDEDREGRVMACAPAVVVHEDDRLDWFARDWSVPGVRALELRRDNHLPMSSVSVTAEAAREAGGWTAEHERGGDWDLWKRILAGPGRVSLAREPSVLHFRALARRQSRADRVRQNEEWLARLAVPAEVDRAREAMHARRILRDGEEYAHLVALYDEHEQLERDRRGGEEELERLRAQLAQATGQRDTLRLELDAHHGKGRSGLRGVVSALRRRTARRT